ncbi:MAG: sulfurtransferase TusA family protein [Candidatus Thalassarchaeaceae archaeon]|jgi:TusA-related sulfurtransferase|nr:sulfurtransferase TusA family protein [Candidatus Thalassarchaeaceae archaeon]MDP6703657.1 sulfurtransferase TusA family protein [Candidatus Thalassarchaeaceae archaeon]MDP7003714.1 sulfurtransferase TusA family protein [Candidatus Thalassarchaeaceae archaeon]
MSSAANRRLDLVGFLCPIPIHETRRALEVSEEGDVLEVVCDDPETLHDIPALCDRMGITLERVAERSGEYTFVISKKAVGL